MRLVIGLLFLATVALPACELSDNTSGVHSEWTFSQCLEAYDELQFGYYPCLSGGDPDSCQPVLDVPCGEGCRLDRYTELQRQADLKKAIIKNCPSQGWFPQD